VLHDPSPSSLYTLLILVFDHGSSVGGAGDGTTACGGVERPFCIRLVEASYLDADGNWVAWPIDPAVVSSNAGDVMACAAVPARPSTWGAIKARYR
jgi:hypothetical protein